eukprot:TRINITY_DN5755_c0_g1_i1.p1 TRINITY_DN5755_c0_g1~~TRINITY_DN5755_c0_g1_i1.p1  ORF type:complete len:1123 (+),score=238.40 TRINITY_DN5755_c0_g1_i1:34-3369(+)
MAPSKLEKQPLTASSANTPFGSDSSAFEEDVTTVVKAEPHRNSTLRISLFVLLSVITGGLGFLLAQWIPKLRNILQRVSCALKDADAMVITGIDHSITVCPILSLARDGSWVEVTDEILRIGGDKRMFEFRHVRFIIDDEYSSFEVTARAMDTKYTHTGAAMHAVHNTGIVYEEHRNRLVMIGPNEIDIRAPTLPRMFMDEIMHPFNLFQVFSVCVWIAIQYFVYSGAIVLMTGISIVTELYSMRKHWNTLRDMAAMSLKVHVIRDSRVMEVDSRELVPGDMFHVVNNSVLPCDAVLMHGSAVINEAMLTGESVPVLKTALPNDDSSYDKENDKGHTMFCGTQVLQTRPAPGSQAALAVVVRTGFATAKGKLVQSILFPKPHAFEFYRDSCKFVGGLAIIAFLGAVYSITWLVLLKVVASSVVLRVCDLITIAVPPALPACMSVGTSVALWRLKKQGIFCIQPTRINISGSVQLFCFDKTGTLTEDGLSLVGVQPCSAAGFSALESNAAHLPASLTCCLAACHSLTIVADKVIGDPLEVNLFESTGWTLDESGAKAVVVAPDRSSLQILRRCDFTSALQRMSVVTVTDAGEVVVYTKGAPEVIRELATPSSIPAEFDTVLRDHVREGHRVLACASRRLPDVTASNIAQLSRDAIEQQLTFEGLVVMNNNIKPQSAPTIQALRAAGIRCVMVTGDHALTAAHVARVCGMIQRDSRVLVADVGSDGGVTWTDPDSGTDLRAKSAGSSEILATVLQSDVDVCVTGRAFVALHHELSAQEYDKLLVHAKVFARMPPEYKAQLVRSYAEMQCIVGMCGDGANDCNALKAAHVGVSLSEAEASIAAPFTSKIQDISCIVELTKQGRCALSTSISVFKFVMMYSLMQFFSVCILYLIYANLADFMYLWDDAAVVLPLAMTMTFTQPSDTLHNKRPMTTLFSVAMFTSIIGQVAIQWTFEILAVVLVSAQSWFEWAAPDPSSGAVHATHWTTAVWLLANFQYITLAIAYNVKDVFRRSAFTNPPFVISLVIVVTLNVLLMFVQPEAVLEFFELLKHELDFRGWLFLLVIINSILSLLFERLVVAGGVITALRRLVRRQIKARKVRTVYKTLVKAEKQHV